METKTHAPTFNTSIRGYDREEVDDYLDSLAEALEHVAEADEQSRRLHAHINRLNSRIKELEDQLQDCTPRAGLAVGDRVGSILREAEEAAAEILRAAEARAAEADEVLGSAVSRGDEEARRIVAEATAEAHGIVAEAEARAAARTRQIEQWADQVISLTRAEEGRMLREHEVRKAAAAEELAVLANKRREASGVLTALREALGEALGLVPEEAEPGPAARSAHPSAAVADAVPAVPAVGAAAVEAAVEPAVEAESTGPSTGEVIELRVVTPSVDEDALEDWVSEGGRNSDS